MLALNRQFYLSTSIFILTLYLPRSQAEFALDFLPDTGTGVMSTSMNRQVGQDGPTTQTPFLLGAGNSQNGPPEQPEFVTDPDNGQQYIHVIMGSLAEGFAQDVYIQHSGSSDCYGSYSGGAACVPSGSFSGDHTTSRIGNASDPLGSNPALTGTGTGNPERVIMRQFMNNGEVTVDFIKDKYDRKPAIASSLNSPDISVNFSVDMRNSTYADINTPGIVTNNMILFGSDLPTDSAVFNMATDSQYSNVDAGRFTYTAGAGPGGSAGTYDYIDSNFDHNAIDWASYIDINDPTNIWAFTTNKPQ